MNLNGPILVVTSISLLVSVAWIRESRKDAPLPDRIATSTAPIDPCKRYDFGTIFGRTTCDKIGHKDDARQRRATAGGAVFISVSKD